MSTSPNRAPTEPLSVTNTYLTRRKSRTRIASPTRPLTSPISETLLLARTHTRTNQAPANRTAAPSSGAPPNRWWRCLCGWWRWGMWGCGWCWGRWKGRMGSFFSLRGERESGVWSIGVTGEMGKGGKKRGVVVCFRVRWMMVRSIHLE